MIKNFRLKIEFVWLSLILLLSIILNFWNLAIEGYANAYYAAGVKSMLMSFKNFFFVASDPSGFVSIDKPPVGFWFQTISAKIFGFSGWSIILPQAIAGVLSVALLYFLVKKSFGSFAGLIAALCLTVTPIFVAASRNNTIDNQLVLCLLIACWFLLKAAEKGKLTYLIASLAFVGIGFNIKMAEAYLVVPAIYITYFLSSSLSFKKKTLHLIAGSAILILVSLSWAFVVDLVPTSSRPFVGSSTDNSVLELIIGHNGLERIGLNNKLKFSTKNSEKNLAVQTKKSGKFAASRNEDKSENRLIYNNTNKSIHNDVSTGMGNSSKPGIARLFSNNNMSDQISWLLPFALLGFIAAAIKVNLKYPFDNKRKLSLLLWFSWLIPEVIYFSFTSGSFHTYYLTTMAPSIAALVGIGLSAMCNQYNEGGWKSFLLPSAFIVNGFVEILFLSYNYNKSNSYRLLTFITVILCFSASISLYLLNIYKNRVESKVDKNSTDQTNFTAIKKILVFVAFAGIIITPTVWSFTPLFYRMNGSSPSAGLEIYTNGQKATTPNNSKLINFLKSNRTTEKYLVAVPSAETYGSDIILESGEPVMTIGGFSGSDKIITLEQFEQLVNNGDLRYAIVGGGPSKNASTETSYERNSSNNITSWIQANGKVVPPNDWQTSKTSGNTANKQKAIQLYDLSSR